MKMPKHHKTHVAPLTADMTRRLPLTMGAVETFNTKHGEQLFAWYMKPCKEGPGCMGIECDMGKSYQIVPVAREEAAEADAIAREVYKARFA